MDYKNLTPELASIIRNMIEQNPEFSNVARPKPTKASASSNSTQKTWGGKANAKPSTATQGSWDSTNTPGGVAATSKEVWTKDQMAAFVAQTVAKQLSFANKPVVPTGKVSASSQPSYKPEGTKYGKISAATQPSWKKDEEYNLGAVSASTQSAWRQNAQKDSTVLRYNAGSIKKFTEI